MTESLGAKCHTFSDFSDRGRGRVGAPTAFPRVVLLVFTVMLLFGAVKAQAALTVRSADGGPACRFEDNGDLYLGGLLAEFGGNTIPSPPAGSYSWRILDSSGNTILVLFKSQATLNNVTYYPGDMIIKGSASVVTSISSGDPYVWRLKNASGAVVALVNNSGNLILLCETGQTLGDKVKTYSSFPLTTSIASDRFRYDADDLDFMANKGDAYTVWDTNTNPPNDRPTEEYDPEVTDYPYWYDEKESWHGCGDLWVTTWVKNDNGTPVLLMANGDGYGLSYRRFVGTSPAAYQRIGTSSDITWYPTSDGYRLRGWCAAPTIAISRFSGSPGSGGTGTGKLGWTIDDPLAGPGETIARFLRSYDTVVPETGELDDPDYDDNHIPKNPDTGQYPTYYYKETDPHIDSHSYRTPRELKPTGMIHFATGSDGTTYLACQDHNPNYPETISGSNSDNWEPTAAAQHVYIFKSTDQGVTWGPTESDGSDYLPRLDLDSDRRVWTNYKFTTPVFCQFGMAYGDYGDAFPTEAATAKYLYAFSPHERWWNQDNLYLARAKVYDSTSGGWQTDNILSSGNWSYWAGTDSSGQPIWASSDATKAAPILHAKGEIAQPSVIYHKDSGLYLMTTFSNSGNTTLDGWPNGNICPNSEASTSVPMGGQKDPHWILWQAPKPWGPWKKVFTNDYNGLQTDHSYPDPYPAGRLDKNRKGFEGYNVQIMPSWTSTSGTGEWSVWVLHAGFRDFFDSETNPPTLVFENVGDPPHTVEITHPYNFFHDWLKGYTVQFSQITLSQKTKPISASLSPMYQHEQNNTPAFSASAIMVGHHFNVTESRTVTHLGRYFVTGNSGTHTLKIVRVTLNADGKTATWVADEPNASVSLNLGTGNFTPDQMDEHGFVYAKLASPVTLSLDTDHTGYHYLLLSSEGGTGSDAFFGGLSKNAELVPDSGPNWYLKPVLDLPEVSEGRVLQIEHSVTQVSSGNTWKIYPNASQLIDEGIYGVYGNAYGAVSVLFQQDSAKAPYAMHSATTVSPPTFTSERLVGVRFMVANDTIVSALGRMKVSGNTKVHEVRLMLEDGATYTTVASIPIRMYSTTANGDYVYRDLATPVRLLSGKTYVLVSREFSGVGEDYCGESTLTNLNRGGQFVAFVNVDPYKPKACRFPWNADGSLGTRVDGTVSTCLGGVNLKYH